MLNSSPKIQLPKLITGKLFTKDTNTINNQTPTLLKTHIQKLLLTL